MKNKKTYKAKPGARFNDEKAQRYGKEIEKLASKNGGNLDTEQIVESSRDKKSPLHDYFEWNDSTAGELYRRTQARHLVNRIEVVIYEDGHETSMPIMINLKIIEEVGEKKSEKRTYFQTDIVMKNEVLFNQLLNEAEAELIGLKTKYKNYKELHAIFSEAQQKISQLHSGI